MQNEFDVIIIGGGTGGIMTAAQLKRNSRKITVGLIEPGDKHYYQPAWTLVGAGTFDFKSTVRDEKNMIPKGVEWIREFAEKFIPEQNKVTTKSGKEFFYKYLVISSGIQSDIDALPGLQEALQKENVCSNYINPEKTFRVLKNFKGGNAVFTQPATPIRCGGAPQKIMYLAESFFRKHHVREKTNVIYATPGSVIFGVKEFADALNKEIASRNIIFQPQHTPISIDSNKNEITFRINKSEFAHRTSVSSIIHERFENDLVTLPYDMLHLAPPQSAPDFIKDCPFSYKDGTNKGWLEVDKETLQHPVYKNVFGIGDSAALPTAKTGAAIRKQAPVVVASILKQHNNSSEKLPVYSGYSSCPIVTDYGKMLLCEFKYNNVRDSDKMLTRFFDTTKPLFIMWILKKYGLPWLYWNMMMKGRM